MKYKKYFRKTSLKQKGHGEFFLNEVLRKKPKYFLEIGVFHGVTARNVCELLYKIHQEDFKYIGLDLFGVSIGLWVISEFLYKFWSPNMRFFSGFVGFLVLMIFGIMPNEVFQNISEYWWIILFWLPGLLATRKPGGTRTYKWYFAGMIAYMSAFAIWLTGVPESETCNPDTIFQAHGFWHLLTALSTIFFFYHYRSEKLVQD